MFYRDIIKELEIWAQNKSRKPLILRGARQVGKYARSTTMARYIRHIISTVFRGRIAEHIVGQELLTTSFSTLYSLNFWTREKKESSAEVDYVVSHKGMLIPIEVKAGASGKLRSLHQFVDAAPHDWAVRFYSGKMSVEDGRTIAGKNYKLITLPYYLAGQLDRILKDNIG